MTLMSSLLGAITSVITVVTSSLVSGKTMHDSALHASVVGSNFRPLFHSVLLFPESQGVWRPAGQDGDQERLRRGRRERQDPAACSKVGVEAWVDLGASEKDEHL